MIRRSNLAGLVAAIVLLLHLTTCSAADRPNIIFVMTDDQGYGDLAAHGHPFLKTPNLDKLYQQSARFTDYHVSPTCAPTRAALMSGKNPFEVGVTHTIVERERMALGVPTIAEVLRDAGYATGIFGKWHLGEEDAINLEAEALKHVPNVIENDASISLKGMTRSTWTDMIRCRFPTCPVRPYYSRDSRNSCHDNPNCASNYESTVK